MKLSVIGGHDRHPYRDEFYEQGYLVALRLGD